MPPPAVNPGRWWALIALAFAQFITIMDSSTLGVALVPPGTARRIRPARGAGGHARDRSCQLRPSSSERMIVPSCNAM